MHTTPPPPPTPYTSYSPSSNTPSHNVVSLPLLPTPTTREHPLHSPAYLPPLVTTEEDRLERAMSLLVPPSFVSGAAYDMTFCHELLPLRLPLLVLPWRCRSPFSLLHPPPFTLPPLPSVPSSLLLLVVLTTITASPAQSGIDEPFRPFG